MKSIRILAILAITLHSTLSNCSEAAAKPAHDQKFRLLWRNDSVEINQRLLEKSKLLSTLAKWDQKLLDKRIIPMVSSPVRPNQIRAIQDLYDNSNLVADLDNDDLITVANIMDYLQIQPDSLYKKITHELGRLLASKGGLIDFNNFNDEQESFLYQLGTDIRNRVIRLYRANKLVSKGILHVEPIGRINFEPNARAEFSNNGAMIAIEHINNDEEVFVPSTISIKQLNLLDDPGVQIAIGPQGIGSFTFSTNDELISITPDPELSRSDDNGHVNIFDVSSGNSLTQISTRGRLSEGPHQEDDFPIGSIIFKEKNPLQIAISTDKNSINIISIDQIRRTRRTVSIPTRSGVDNRKMAISPDKKFIAIAQDKIVEVRNLNNGELITKLIDHRINRHLSAIMHETEFADLSAIQNIAISKDNQYVVTASYYNIKIWDALSGKLLQEIKTSRMPDTIVVSNIDISYDNKYLAISSANNILIFSMKDGEIIAKYKGPENMLTKAMKFTPNNDIIWAGSLLSSRQNNVFRITGVKNLDSIDYSIFMRQPKTSFTSKLRTAIGAARQPGATNTDTSFVGRIRRAVGTARQPTGYAPLPAEEPEAQALSNFI